MKFDTGTIIAVGAALLFYLRLIILQRQKVKRMRQAQSKGKGKSQPQPRIEQQLGFQITSWWMVAFSAALILFGALVSAVDWFGPTASDYWWVPLTLGILVMNFSVR